MSQSNLQIIEFQPQLAHHFKSINMAWIEHYFEPEAEDMKVLNDPKKHLIDTGGNIVFAEYKGQIVGTCGLKKWSDTEYELVKMGVLDNYQGLQLGYHLGQAVIELAERAGCKRLFLETNKKLKPAINLYKKLGFQEFSNDTSRCDYQRCDLYMELFFN
ncbi:MAG: GNAT family N-acetyltransferase [Gammaproteobacteria bacterium]|nr:GNAT family N-acetyltransferase [Gammaproteobacteria bacterium]